MRGSCSSSPGRWLRTDAGLNLQLRLYFRRQTFEMESKSAVTSFVQKRATDDWFRTYLQPLFWAKREVLFFNLHHFSWTRSSTRAYNHTETISVQINQSRRGHKVMKRSIFQCLQRFGLDSPVTDHSRLPPWQWYVLYFALQFVLASTDVAVLFLRFHNRLGNLLKKKKKGIKSPVRYLLSQYRLLWLERDGGFPSAPFTAGQRW